MTLTATPLIRRLRALCRPPAPRSGPPGEGAWARQLRHLRDRTRLAELDDRLLRDMGLRREISAAGFDCVPVSSAAPAATAKLGPSSDDCRSRPEPGPAAASS